MSGCSVVVCYHKTVETSTGNLYIMQHFANVSTDHGDGGVTIRMICQVIPWQYKFHMTLSASCPVLNCPKQDLAHRQPQ